jgi:hypothetical protein
MANVGTVTRGIGPLSETQSGFFAGVVGGPLAAVAAAVALAAGAVSTARGNPTLWRFAGGDDAALANADVAALPAVIAGEPP